MPPYENSYSSELVGSLRVAKANNTTKHGTGSLLVENSLDFYGSSDQYVKSSNVASDLYLESGKNLNVNSVSTTHLQGANVNLTSGSSAQLKATTGEMLLEASAGDTRIKSASGNTLFLNGGTLQAQHTTINTTSVAETLIKSSGANVTIQADNLEARLYGKSLAHVRGDASKLESIAGKTEIIASTDVEVSGQNCSLTSTTKSSLSAPTCEVAGSLESIVNAPIVSIGATANDVNVSSAGKNTNIQGHCVVSGNLTINGTTTQIDTQQVLVKDNVMVLNDASAVDKDAGFLFKRNAQDSQAFYWDESVGEFVFGSTESAHDASQIVHKAYSTLHAKNIILEEGMAQPGFATESVLVPDNAITEVPIPNITKTRGAFDFHIESVAEGGAIFNYEIVKAKSSSESFSMFGVHQPNEDTQEQVWVSWGANSTPKVYHKTLKTGGSGANITYKVKVLSVSS